MKLAVSLAVAVCLLAAGSTAHALEEPPPEQIAAATAWIVAMLDGSAVAPTQARPLEYGNGVSPRTCKKVKAGRASNAKQLDRFRRCLRDALAQLDDDDTSPFEDVQWFAHDSSARSFDDYAPAKLARKVKALTKRTIVVEGHFLGNGITVDVFLVFGPDGGVRLVWLDEGYFE